MQHLLADWKNVESLIKKNDVILGLDYDGTLVPIAEHPYLARLSLEGRESLRELSLLSDVLTVIIMSGRGLEELKRMVGILPGFYYAGNHGFEMEGPLIHFVHPEALETKELMGYIEKQLCQALRVFPDIFVENKIFTLSVHYRQLPEEKSEPAKQIFLEILRPYTNSSRVILTEGKKVWEIRPAIDWNKGMAFSHLLSQLPIRTFLKPLSLSIGDDQTDEDVFKAIMPSGIGIKVTQNANEFSHARYYLRSPDEVLDFLGRFANLVREKRKIFHAWH